MITIRYRSFPALAVLLATLLAVSLLFTFPVSAKTPDWSKTYPNSNGKSNCVIAVDDGYVFAGISNGGFLLAKADLSGGLIWWKTYEAGEATCVIQTSDGGYALAGQGDVNFIKTDSSGNLQWSKSYTYDNDTYKITSFRVNSIAQTPEDGFILAGKTPSGAILGWDWAINIDKDGNMLWGKTYGETYGASVVTNMLAVDDGYVLAGNELLLKIDMDGNVLWRKPSKVSDSLIKTVDGGFLLIASTGYGGDRELLKTDSQGNTLWNRTYQFESAVATHLRLAFETCDGGFLVCAWVYPEWESVIWLIKTDSTGTPIWNLTTSTIKGYNSRAYSIIQAGNGEYVYCGAVVNVNYSNDTQVWLAKTSEPNNAPTITPAPLQPTPTPTTSTQTQMPTQTVTLYVDPPIPYWQPLLFAALAVVFAVSGLLYLRRRKKV